MLKAEFLIVLGCFSLLTLLAGVAFSRQNYFSRFKSKYSFKNMFPFEFNFRGSFADNMLGNVFMIVSFISLMLLYSLFEGARTETYGIITFIGGCLASLMVCALFFVSTRFLKVHILLVAFAYAIIFLTIATTALLNLKYYQFYQHPLPLVGFIYSIVLGVVTFALAMNPKLSFRINAKQEDGKEDKFVRPNWIPIAFTEWMMMLILYLNQIGIIIFAISVSLKFL